MEEIETEQADLDPRNVHTDCNKLSFTTWLAGSPSSPDMLHRSPRAWKLNYLFLDMSEILEERTQIWRYELELALQSWQGMRARTASESYQPSHDFQLRSPSSKSTTPPSFSCWRFSETSSPKPTWIYLRLHPCKYYIPVWHKNTKTSKCTWLQLSWLINWIPWSKPLNEFNQWVILR